MQHIKDRLKLGVIIAAIILPCMFIANNCKGQSFNGFASLRMGYSESDFINAIKNETGEIKVVTEKNISKIQNEWIKYQLNKNEPLRLYQLKYKGDYINWPIVLYDNKSLTLSNYQDTCSIYFLPKYKLGEIELENIFIVFKNKTLQLIELNDSYDLLKAAKEKYNPTDASDTSYKIKCVFVVSGVPEEKLVSKRYSKWEYENYSIEASSGLDYNDKCKTIVWGYIRFISNELLAFINNNTNQNEKKSLETEKNKINSIKDKL